MEWIDGLSYRPTYRPMASPEAFLAALHAFSPLLSTSDARRSDPGDVNAEVKSFITALAAISVARPRQDVIAVTLDPRPHWTEIYIATNGNVQQSVKDHICGVWSSLTQLSKHSVQIRLPLTAKWQTITQIYRFTWQKFQQRVKKRADVCTLYFQDALNLKGPFTKDELDELRRIEPIFQEILASSQLEDPSKEDLKSLAKSIDKLSRRLMPLLSDDAEDRLMLKFQRFGSKCIRCIDTHFHKIDVMCPELSRDYLDVERYMEKIVSLRNSINALFRIAQNKKFKQWFSTPLHMTLVQGKSQTFLVDMNNPDLLRQCFGGEQAVAQAHDRWQSKVVAQVHSELTSTSRHQSNKFNSTVRVHCECAMVVFLEQRPNETLIHFIGVSKLCCHGCYVFIRAYNDRNVRIRYEFAGTHGKVYIPYVFPLISGRTSDLHNKVKHEVLRILRNDFRAAWTQPRKGRSYSDSTAASFVPIDEGEVDQGGHS